MTPVKISGATGNNCSKINGIFVPTTEVFGGQVVYQKQGDEEVWLEYRNVAGSSEGTQWWIVSTEGKGGKSSGRYAYSTTGLSALVGTTEWDVNSGGEFVSGDLVLRQDKPEPLHNNFERSVKETQIRLWCYRKVVHKSFCDMVAKFVRYQFPRRLKDHVEAVIHKSLRVGAVDADESAQEQANGINSLLALMAETQELSGKRKSLQTSVRNHDEALKVMVDLKRQRLA